MSKVSCCVFFAGFHVSWSHYITWLWKSGTLHIMACVRQTSANCLMPVTCWLSAVSREPNAVLLVTAEMTIIQCCRLSHYFVFYAFELI